MAGRKPRRTRDEQAGVTPLHGVPVAGIPAAGSRVRRKADPKPCIGTIPVGSQANPSGTVTGVLPPQPYGHKINEIHGMDSQQVVARQLVEPYIRAVLDDPRMPDHLRSPQFADALEAWARLQYLTDRAFAKVAVSEFEEMAEPLGRSGQGKSLLELYLRLESMTAKLRGDLGMTPAHYARLRASLGLAHQAEADALRKLASQGAAITSARAAIEPVKPAAPGLVPDEREQAALIGQNLVQQSRQRGD